MNHSSRPGTSASSVLLTVEQASKVYINANVTFDQKIPKEIADLCFKIAQGIGPAFATGYNRIHVFGYERGNESDDAGWTHVKKGMRICDIHLGILKNVDWKNNKKQRGAIMQTFFHEVFLHGSPALDRESEGRPHKKEKSDHRYVYSPIGEKNSFLMGAVSEAECNTALLS